MVGGWPDRSLREVTTTLVGVTAKDFACSPVTLGGALRYFGYSTRVAFSDRGERGLGAICPATSLLPRLYSKEPEESRLRLARGERERRVSLPLFARRRSSAPKERLGFIVRLLTEELSALLGRGGPFGSIPPGIYAPEGYSKEGYRRPHL